MELVEAEEAMGEDGGVFGCFWKDLDGVFWQGVAMGGTRYLARMWA